MDSRLEVVVVPVADVDRAVQLYQGLGWRLDGDYVTSEDLRVVQLTPPGSPCSVIIGTGLTPAAPGSAQGMHLVVTDINTARDELTRVGAEVSEVFHDSDGVPGHSGSGRWRPAGPRVQTRSTAATVPSPRSVTPTATSGCCRRSPPACRAGEPGTPRPPGPDQPHARRR